jgi:hypothetical protein
MRTRPAALTPHGAVEATLTAEQRLVLAIGTAL